MTDDLLVEPGTRLLHIGPHKTGSSAVQVGMHRARQELDRQGVHYAGPRERPKKAVWSIGVRGRPAGVPVPPVRLWERLVAEVEAAGDQRVCLSNEDLGRATDEQIARIVGELGGDRVHVVAVARRLDRYLPSQWQERVKAGDVRPYEEWLHTVLDEDAADSWDHRNVWFSHDIAALVDRWTRVVGPQRFTLVLSDEVDRRLLPDTFEQLLGLEPGTIGLHAEASNRGLSWSETELLRAYNVEADARGWDALTRRHWVKGGMLLDMMGRPAPSEGRRTPPLPSWAADRIRRLSAARVEAIAAMDVRVVGDPAWMLMPDDTAVSDDLDAPAVPASVAAKALMSFVDLAHSDAAEREAEHAAASSRPDEEAPTAPAHPEEPCDRGHRRWGIRLRGRGVGS